MSENAGTNPFPQAEGVHVGEGANRLYIDEKSGFNFKKLGLGLAGSVVVGLVLAKVWANAQSAFEEPAAETEAELNQE